MPIVGFLLAGVLIGPIALGVVREREIIDAAAEVGVILLPFTIGIEFTISRLMAIRRLVLLGGSLQVAGAVGLTTGVLVLAGADLRPALFTGLLVSQSSTAIVLKLLGDRSQTSSPTGQAGRGLLIFQDLAVVAMILLLPILAGGDDAGPADFAQALATAAAVIVVTLVVARHVMPPVLEAAPRACSPEVFLLSVIAPAGARRRGPGAPGEANDHRDRGRADRRRHGDRGVHLLPVGADRRVRLRARTSRA